MCRQAFSGRHQGDVRRIGCPLATRALSCMSRAYCGPQEVRRLDLGANASSGTSNEGDDAQADDGDNWSEEQNRALQVDCWELRALIYNSRAGGHLTAR